MYLSARAQVASLLTLAALSSGTAAASFNSRATVCNGHAELCDRSYGNISFVGAHDSYAVGSTNLAANQDYDVTQQLNDGIRMLQMQAHLENNEIHLCHTSCILLDGGTLQDYLTKVKAWMDDNTSDVVTLLIVNSDSITPAQFDSAFQGANIASLGYVPPSLPMTVSSWPTLGSMIDNGTRLVTFLDTGSDGSVNYIIDEFTNMWETAFDVTDTTFDCEVNRTKGDSSTQLYTINHFLDSNTDILGTTTPTPDKDALNTTNSASGTGSLGLQASQCGAQYGRSPNFMLVDFYEWGTPSGSVFQVAASLNGVTYSPSSPVATPIVSGSSSSSTSASGGSAVDIPRGMWMGAVTVVCGTALGAWTLF